MLASQAEAAGFLGEIWRQDGVAGESCGDGCGHMGGVAGVLRHSMRRYLQADDCGAVSREGPHTEFDSVFAFLLNVM